MAGLIPSRPKVKRAWSLSASEMDCLVWYALTGCKQDVAYHTFVHPEYSASPRVLREYSQQFFSTKEANEFLKAYKREISVLIESANSFVPTATEEGEETRETKKERAAKQLFNKVVNVISEVDTIEGIETATKLADRVGVLDSQEATIIIPQRFLSERCSECRYKKFIDEHVASGDIVDDKENEQDKPDLCY